MYSKRKRQTLNAVSSSYVENLLEEGEFEKAAKLNTYDLMELATLQLHAIIEHALEKGHQNSIELDANLARIVEMLWARGSLLPEDWFKRAIKAHYKMLAFVINETRKWTKESKQATENKPTFVICPSSY